MKDTKIQWHPGFVAAINLELAKNRDGLMFEKEYNLNTKPLEIDLLVIKKKPDIYIDNEIGHIFKGHNILEYKSPEDHLNIDVFYKTGAYASLYKSYGSSVDSIKAEDITVSLVRDAKPLGLFHYFEEHGYPVSNPYQGIYYIKEPVLFPTQIIITRELERSTHTWLRALSERLDKQDIKELVENTRCLKEKYDRELADSVLEVSIQANGQIIEKLKGESSMGQALMKLMEPELLLREKEAIEKGIEKGIEQGIEKGIEQGIEKGIEQGIEKGIEKGIEQGIEKGKIYGMVYAYRDMQIPDDEILRKVQDKFQLSLEKAKEYL